MRHNQNRRSRGRNNSNRKGPNPLTRSYESNGPDVKVRGTAAHVAEKYMSLARDAQSAGDIVAVENYLQHAEHYNRIVMAAQAQFQQSQPQFRDNSDEGYDDDRPMNGRDRFEYNGAPSGPQGEDGGEDRFEGEDEGDDQRGGFRQIPPPRQNDQMQPRQNDQMQGRQYDRQNDQNRQQRGPRPDRYERPQRPDYRDNPDRGEQERGPASFRGERDDRPQRADNAERFQPAEGPQPDVAPPVQATVAPIQDETAPAPRRRRGRPPRAEAGAADTAAGEDTTPDGAAALAAFPE